MVNWKMLWNIILNKRIQIILVLNTDCKEVTFKPTMDRNSLHAVTNDR